jgi:hypothetical protein
MPPAFVIAPPRCWPYLSKPANDRIKEGSTGLDAKEAALRRVHGLGINGILPLLAVDVLITL